MPTDQNETNELAAFQASIDAAAEEAERIAKAYRADANEAAANAKHIAEVLAGRNVHIAKNMEDKVIADAA